MYISPTLLFSLPITALASGSALNRLPHHHQARDVLSGAGKTFRLDTLYQGKTFFEGWDFFTDPDPTHGLVNFVDQQDAFSQGLAFVQDDNTTVLAVDDKTSLRRGQNRNSVRITSKKTFNGGLFIADIFAMPHGCGSWPAYWSTGPDWPNGGEIDIVEGVNNQATNQYTLHTGPGCTVSSTNKRDVANVQFTGKLLGTECTSSGDDNEGCAVLDTDPNSFGKGFNLLAGGVFAHLWDSTGIKVWHFPRGAIPSDIDAKTPNPSSWPEPAAVFSSKGCDIESHFRHHSLIFDITLCGDWAGATYNQMGCPGTCEQAVQNPNNFHFAKWKINYVAVYQK